MPPRPRGPPLADLHFGDDQPTDAESAAIDAIVPPADAATVTETERLVRGGRSRRQGLRHLLLPVLHSLQHEIGWISPGGLNGAAERLGVPPAEAYGVATFYELLRTTDPGHRDDVVHVCVDPACALAGGDEVRASLEASGAKVHDSPCLGQCDRAPALFVQGVGRPDRVPADYDEEFRLPQTGDPGLRVLRRVGEVDPTSLESYRDYGGYQALATAIEMGADAVIAAISDSGLSGRGGAAFPTGIKWRAVADEPGPDKHVVANCDESEPGTFKDRIVWRARSILGYRVDDHRWFGYRCHPRVDLHPRRVPPSHRPLGRGHRPGSGRRAVGRRRGRQRAALRHRAAPGGGGLHLRRGDGAVQLHRGLPGRAPQQTPLPHHPRPVLPAHRHQQPRNPHQRIGHRGRWP